jgi:hypothetical protein
MTVKDVMTKIRVMLSEKTEEVVDVLDTKMAEATLVDGTKVYSEGELAPGSILYVAVEEGEAPFAPAGLHETTDGFLVTVGENGEIISVETKSEDATEEIVEETMEEEVIEEEIVKEFEIEDLVEAIAEMLQPQTAVIEELKKELSTLKERFNVVAGEPAATRVKNTFSEEAKSAKGIAEARFERLVELRKGKK